MSTDWLAPHRYTKHLDAGVRDLIDVALGRHPEYPVSRYNREHHQETMRSYRGHRIAQMADCTKCSRRRWGLWFDTLTSSGVHVASLRCIVCTRQMKAIGAAKIAPDLPMWADGTTHMPPCERCGSTAGVENHHWAPRHLFNDADEWPMSWLCRKCHQTWHKIVTPNMARTVAS